MLLALRFRFRLRLRSCSPPLFHSHSLTLFPFFFLFFFLLFFFNLFNHLYIYLSIYLFIYFVCKKSSRFHFLFLLWSDRFKQRTDISFRLSLSLRHLWYVDAICTFPLLRRDKSLVSTLLDSQRTQIHIYRIYTYMYVRAATRRASIGARSKKLVSHFLFFLFFPRSLSLSLSLSLSFSLSLSLSLSLTFSPFFSRCLLRVLFALSTFNYFCLNVFSLSPLDRWLRYRKKM